VLPDANNLIMLGLEVKKTPAVRMSSRPAACRYTGITNPVFQLGGARWWKESHGVRRLHAHALGPPSWRPVWSGEYLNDITVNYGGADVKHQRVKSS